MKTQFTQQSHKDHLVTQEYKKRMQEVSKDLSALTRFEKIESARLEVVRHLSRMKNPGTAKHKTEIFGIATGLLGCLSIIATTQVTSGYSLPAATALIIAAPSLAMIFAGAVLANMGAYARENARLEKDPRDEIGDLSQLLEAMEKMEEKIVRDHGAEIITELGKCAPVVANEKILRLREVMLRQLHRA